MKLQPNEDASASPRATFEPRRLEDLPFEPRPEAFKRVEKVSRQLEQLYAQWLSPLMRQIGNPITAYWLERLHPMRTSRLGWSEKFSPAAAGLPLALWALQIWGAPDGARAENPWYRAERGIGAAVHDALASWRHVRDRTAELVFQSVYGA